MKKALLLVLALIAILPISLQAQQIPDNASRVSFGKGWVCNAVYVERGSSCIHVSVATDQEVRRFMIMRSIASYSGTCACPFNVDRGGRRCGGRSAYSRPGGAAPLCYDGDITDRAVQQTRERYPSN